MGALLLSVNECEQNGWENPELLDTLAACYARIGDFKSAAEWQEKAIELDSEKMSYKSRLLLYREKKPYTEANPLIILLLLVSFMQ